MRRRVIPGLWNRFPAQLILPPLLAVGILLNACSGRVDRAVSEDAPRQDQLPSRIVSLSPSVTEILYAVGAWPQVVAVSQYCTYPEDVTNKPRVDGWLDTSLEQVVALKPDLVIGIDTQAAFIQDKLTGLGIRTMFVKSQGIEEVFTAFNEIGQTVGRKAEAGELAAQVRHELESVRNAVAGLPRPRVLCVADRVPGTLRDIHTATRGSFLDELIGIAGGESIAPPAEQQWGKITKEAVLALDPQVIIDMVQSPGGQFGEDVMEVWGQLAEVRAVREKRVYPIRDPSVIHPSQFIGRTAQAFARLIHPEAFHDETR